MTKILLDAETGICYGQNPSLFDLVLVNKPENINCVETYNLMVWIISVWDSFMKSKNLNHKKILQKQELGYSKHTGFDDTVMLTK